MKDLTLTVKKLERKQKDTFQFKNVGIAKQAEFLQQVGDWMEDSLKAKLEAKLGRVPTELQEVITAGESLVGERLHLLKIANTWGWTAVTEFTSTDLARTEVEEKKLKKIAKANEAKLEKQRDRKFGKRNQYFLSGGNQSGSGSGNRYCSRKARAVKMIRPSSGNQEREEKTGRKMIGSATSATRLGTSPGTV